MGVPADRLLQCQERDQQPLAGSQGPLIDRQDLSDPRDVGLQIPLDAIAEGHGAGRTIDAGPEKADADHAVGADPDKLDIAVVGLDRRADELDHMLNPRAEIRSWGLGGHAVS